MKHTEDLALSAGLIDREDDYAKLASTRCRSSFPAYYQVGSTGNLGLSIGISAAALGYRTIIHMSADAKQWKKDLLRKKGAEVREYETDYLEAVKQGRRTRPNQKTAILLTMRIPRSFLGYAVAAKRLKAQLEEKGIYTDAEHPFRLYPLRGGWSSWRNNIWAKNIIRQ